MYDPKGNSKTRSGDGVSFAEAKPPPHLRDIVHRFLQIRTPAPLPQGYQFHALPDACTYAVFDQLTPDIAGITRLKASSEELSLGHQFHYVNIRFLPGVWQGNRADVLYGLVNAPYAGEFPLIALNQRLMGHDFTTQQTYLSDFVQDLMGQGIVVANPITRAIFKHMADIHSVADMAGVAGLSPRQLQRVLRRSTGFAPHDFLKIIRLQQSLRGEPSLSYADQSHFIHSFRKATGYTPGQFSRKFDV